MRAYLGSLGITVREQRVSVVDGSGRTVELSHLTAVIPGRSRDVLLLAAHYDTPATPATAAPVRRNDQRASGPALLLELARTLHAGPSPQYTVWLSWIDGDALDGISPRVRLGSQSLVDEWSRQQEFSRIRAAIFVGNVGDRARPMIRDVDSPRVYREIFWEVAHELGYGEWFPADSPYGIAATGRTIFAQAQLRSSIALANQRAPARVAPQASTHGAQNPPGGVRASAGFEAIGNVTLEALARIAEKLQRVDRFARSPLTAGSAEARAGTNLR